MLPSLNPDDVVGHFLGLRERALGAHEDATLCVAPREDERENRRDRIEIDRSGAAGAPKFGDSAAWGPRIGAGYAALLNSALKGKNAMGPQGGGDFSDLEIGRAVVYMANKGGASFAEPKAPAAAASAAN